MDASLLTTKQAAEHLGFAPGTLENWRLEGKGPPWIKIGSSIRYPLDKLIQWIQDNSHSGQSSNA